MNKTGMANAIALLACGCLSGGAVASERTLEQYLEAAKPEMSAEGKFFCNTKALSPAELARHEELTKKLLAKRRSTVETEKGYELQYSPADVAVNEVAEWVVAESKCCPFFDFHLDLENEGKLLCLRLTGEEGIKAFIRSEFHVPTN
jgi:hypothetical protein